uniref:Uncharacterized protein n=1 Tax=Anguilla anguilla TaxID=7936 RepID=A0A0E9S942_ANGAN
MMLLAGTSRFQVELLSLCCISTTLTALPHMEMDSPQTALHPVTSQHQIID